MSTGLVALALLVLSCRAAAASAAEGTNAPAPEGTTAPLLNDPTTGASARALAGEGLDNLVAFARLCGCVRHFHPSDEAVAADWTRFVIAGVERVEGAIGPEDLVRTLREQFAFVAPSIRIGRGEMRDSLAVPAGATQWISWRHSGYGQESEGGAGYSPYSSRIVRESIPQREGENVGSRPGTAIVLDLGSEVRALVPIGVYGNATRTLPKTEGMMPRLDRSEGWEPSAADRSTRLAGVILAWNVLQHFYPYFDVVATDWPSALRAALESAAGDQDETGYRATLERLAAALHDGHALVRGPGGAMARAPLDWEWVGADLVVVTAPDDSSGTAVRPGDVVEAIDGRPVAELYAEAGARISAATEQWRRWRSLQAMGATPAPSTIRLSLRHPDGTTETVPFPTRSGGFPRSIDARPVNGVEVAPGVLYFNLCGAETSALEPLLPALAAARGLVFDLRGYPGSAGRALLPHLSAEPLESARWNVPIFTLPDRREAAHRTARWNLAPEEPRLGGKVVFLTDGRAISYAESCLGIVEQYRLGEIVGEPTAGTNGNVVSITLPGGYGLNFTGMQVIKNDGTRHHGVGIRPTIPARRTLRGIAKGRDELLERAIEVATGS